MAQAQQWTLPARYQRGQFTSHDKFVVVNTSSKVAVESHYSEDRANRARRTLDEHNERNDHAARYTVYPVQPGELANVR
jgi:hypothetical protein